MIRSYLEHLNTTQADNVDSALCIELLKIAQQEKNDSMLAISYDWIGGYLGFTIGDNVSATKLTMEVHHHPHVEKKNFTRPESL